MSEERPKCPRCRKSTGLGVEATVSAQWSRGGWRVKSDAEVLNDASCGCDHCGWVGTVGQCWGDIA